MIRPKCPKCAGWLRPSDDDLLCVACGKLIVREVDPVPLPVRVAPKPVMGRQMEVVKEYMESIRKQRRGHVSWETISRLLRAATGVRMVDKTVKKYFERLSHA